MTCLGEIQLALDCVDCLGQPWAQACDSTCSAKVKKQDGTLPALASQVDLGAQCLVSWASKPLQSAASCTLIQLFLSPNKAYVFVRF